MITNLLLIVAAIAVVGIVFEIVKENIQARKEAASKKADLDEAPSDEEFIVEEPKTETHFKSIQYNSTPTPTPEFKKESESTTADYLSYAGTTVSNETRVMGEKEETESPKKKREYKPRKSKDAKKGGKKEFKKKGKKGGEDNLLLS